MAAPKLDVGVEPAESGSVVYLPLAPRKEGAPKNAQLSLRLDLKNDEGDAVHATLVHLAFADPAAPSAAFKIDLDIGAGDTGTWFFAPDDTVLLPSPTPKEITVSVYCDGFDEPAAVTRPLTYHRSPVAAKSYGFPARAADLRLDEYWVGRSAGHSSAGDGGQLFGYDFGVEAIDWATNTWSKLLPDGSYANNADYRIWGKPVYAMADGEVVSFANDKPTNPNPPADLSPPDPVEGNHFYIQHGDELMLYAHFQMGTLASDLLSTGAAVSKGDFLGLAGNSGNSSAPHLHIHAIEGTSAWAGPLRPIPFHDIQVLDKTETPLTGPNAKWFDVLGRGLPSVVSLIYPEASESGGREWVAVDPLSLVLSRAIYVRLTLPDPPPFEKLRGRIREMIDGMSIAERREALSEAKRLAEYADALEKELSASIQP